MKEKYCEYCGEKMTEYNGAYAYNCDCEDDYDYDYMYDDERERFCAD